MIAILDVISYAFASPEIHFHIGIELYYPIQINRDVERVLQGETDERCGRLVRQQITAYQCCLNRNENNYRPQVILET